MIKNKKFKAAIIFFFTLFFSVSCINNKKIEEQYKVNSKNFIILLFNRDYDNAWGLTTSSLKRKVNYNQFIRIAEDIFLLGKQKGNKINLYKTESFMNDKSELITYCTYTFFSEKNNPSVIITVYFEDSNEKYKVAGLEYIYK